MAIKRENTKNRKIIIEQKQITSACGLLFLFSGVYGMLFFLYGIEGMEVNPWPANFGAAAGGSFLWILKNRNQKRYLGAGMAVLGAGELLGLAFSPELRREIGIIFRGILGTLQEGEAEATGGVVILGLGLVLAGFLIEYILHAHWLLYLAVTFLILLTPLFGHSPGNWPIFLMAVFQLSFWTMTGVKKMSGQRENDLRNKIAIGMFLGFGGIFALAFCVVGFSEESLYQAAYGAEGSIQRTVKQITGLDMSAVDGNVSRGNLYPTGTDQLELITDKIPTETMYLKGFTGGDYERGEWLEDRDEEIYTLMEENSLHWGRWEDWIPGMYESLYYVINQNMKGTAEANTERALMVRYIGGWRGDWYAPYYGIWSRNNQRYADDLYGFRYFQQDEMNIQWDNLRSYFSENGDTYREVQEAYEKEAAEIYTQVPQEEIPRLTELCRTNPMGDLEHITAFILYTLQSNASYTQTPGMFPFNEDPVEYFLF